MKGAPPTTDLSHGITLIDTGMSRPGMVASYLIEDRGEAAFVDVGASPNIPLLLEAMERRGIAPEQVKYVMVSHVHLDHAGAAGALLRWLPRARLVVHPRGAAHMVEPSQLVAAARLVYGAEAAQRLFGEVLPAPPDRVQIAEHGERLALGGRRLLILDTPGHALHHFCVLDEASGALFGGDTLGVSYRELDTPQHQFVVPACSPLDFDPQALRCSIEMLMTHRPTRVLLTHFGEIHRPEQLAEELMEVTERFVGLAKKVRDWGPGRHRHLVELLEAYLALHIVQGGCPVEPTRIVALHRDYLEVGARGLEVWLDRTTRRARTIPARV